MNRYGHPAPEPTAEEHAPEEPDDPQTAFYKQHMKRTQRPHASGRTPIYDFDAWTSSHYGTTFDRRQAAKRLHDHKKQTAVREHDGFRSELTIFSVMLAFVVLMSITVQLSHNEDHVSKKKK